MKPKSSLKSQGTERNRQRKKSDARIARLSQISGITATELRTLQALFPAFYRTLERKAA